MVVLLFFGGNLSWVRSAKIGDGIVAAGQVRIHASYHGLSAMLILLQRNYYFSPNTNVKECTAIMNSSSICPCSFPHQGDFTARQQHPDGTKKCRFHESSYFVVATAAPMLV